MKPKKPNIHSIGTKLRIIESRFFFTRKNQARMAQMITATGYKEMASTKETFAEFTPLSKLINDNPQMTNQGMKESAYKIWVMIKYGFMSLPPQQ